MRVLRLFPGNHGLGDALYKYPPMEIDSLWCRGAFAVSSARRICAVLRQRIQSLVISIS